MYSTKNSKNRMAVSLVFLGVLCLGISLCSPLFATPTFQSEFPICGTTVSTPGNQQSPSVAAGTSGYLVVWQDQRKGNSSDYDVYGILTDSSGNAGANKSFLISSAGGYSAPYNQMTPDVAFNGTNYLVVWVDKGAWDQSPHIYGVRVTQAGALLDSNPILISSSVTYQSYPTVASNGNGWEVAWLDGTTSIMGAAVSAAGVASNPVGFASDSNNKVSPSIGWDGAGYLVAWADDRNSETTGTDIYACRLTSSGSLVAGSLFAVTNATGAQTTPSVAGASSGGFLVAWQDARNVSTGDDVYGARVLTSGTTVTPITIYSATSDQDSPAVAWDGSEYTVAWRDKSTYKTRGTQVSSTGTVLYTAKDLSTSTVGSGAAGIAGRSGNTLVAFSTFDLSNANICGTMITPSFTVGAQVTLSVSQANQPTYAAAYDGSNYVVVWADERSGTSAVYAQKVSAAGSLLGSAVPLGASSVPQIQPAIAFDGTNYMVVWSEGVDGTNTQDIRGVVVDRNLTQVWPSTPGTELSICVNDMNQTSPAIAWNGTKYAVVWTDARNAASPDYSTDLYGALVTPTGVATPFTGVVSQATSSQYAPSIAAFGGGFMAVWQDDRNTTSDVYRTRISSLGAVQDTAGVQVSSATASKTNPKIVADATGYMVVWSDSRNLNYDIYGVRLNATTGARVDANDIAICTQAAYQLAPSIAWANDEYLVTWQDFRNSATSQGDIYFAIVNSSGTVQAPDMLASGAWYTEASPVIVSSGHDSGAVFYSDALYSFNQLVGRVLGSSMPAPSVVDDGLYTSSASSLNATWSDTQPVSEYQYAIGTTPGGTDVVGWTSTGTSTGVSATGLSLVNGTTYYFAVKAKSSSGDWSLPGLSDGIMVDATPPTTPVVTDDGQWTTTSTSLHAVWSATDPESGIGEYQYAIGTTSGGTDVVGWTSVGTLTGVTKTGLSLVSGKTYYFSVKARNLPGLWSAAGNSDGIAVDSTPPSTPVVTDDGNYQCVTDSLHATWSATDAETGVAEYQYAIGTTSGGTDIAGWTSTGTTTQVTKTGLSLVTGKTYYFAVKAKNSIGLWSSVGTSDGIGVAVPTVVSSIPQAKSLTDGTWLTITGRVVSAGTNSLPALSDGLYFYITETDRRSAIKVLSPTVMAAGDVVSITGHVETANGERQIVAPQCVTKTSTGTAPRPLFMKQWALGGTGFNNYYGSRYNKMVGISNIGFLVTVAGVVTYVDPSQPFFFIDDGSKLRDITGKVGVKVYSGTLTKPALNQYVFVTGISSCEPSGADSARRVLATIISVK